MTDKHFKENSLLTGQVIHVDFISINIFFLEITAFRHKRAFFVFRCNALVPKWLSW